MAIGINELKHELKFIKYVLVFLTLWEVLVSLEANQHFIFGYQIVLVSFFLAVGSAPVFLELLQDINALEEMATPTLSLDLFSC